MRIQWKRKKKNFGNGIQFYRVLTVTRGQAHQRSCLVSCLTGTISHLREVCSSDSKEKMSDWCEKLDTWTVTDTIFSFYHTVFSLCVCVWQKPLLNHLLGRCMQDKRSNILYPYYLNRRYKPRLFPVVGLKQSCQSKKHLPFSRVFYHFLFYLWIYYCCSKMICSETSRRILHLTKSQYLSPKKWRGYELPVFVRRALLQASSPEHIKQIA